MSQCKQCRKRWKDWGCPGSLTQTKLKFTTELSGLCSWTRTAARGWRERNESLWGGDAESQSRPGEMSTGQKEKVGMPVVSECAAVQRGTCETESRWGTCQWQVWRWTPSSDNDIWGNQWCLMHGGRDRCHYSTKPYTSKNKAIFLKWKWKRNDRQKAKYLWDDLNKEK